MNSQATRYAFVGLSKSLVGYSIYLILTYIGIPPKTTMTILYVFGASMSYFGNRAFTFSFSGGVFGSLVRYSFAHFLGYSLNLLLLFIFVDRLGYPHQIVQAMAIFIVGGFLFLMMKLFVFRKS